MRALITGISGFVGTKLKNYLISENEWEIWGLSRSPSSKDTNSQVQIFDTNWELDELTQKINKFKPDCIFHLAGQSNVKLSWERKVETFEANLILTTKLLEAVRKSSIAKTVKIITIGSSEEYGQVSKLSIPISEETAINPISPYGISKAAVSMLARRYFDAYGVQCIHLRPFNHIGPGQGLGFVVSDFAHQVARIEDGIQEPVIKVGNLSAKRDFLDVRDIVRIYGSLVINGKAGEIYNICSGRSVEIASLLDEMISYSTKTIKIVTDPSLLRPVDIPVYVGSNEKIKQLGLEPVIPLDESLRDIINYWREIVFNERRIDT